MSVAKVGTYLIQTGTYNNSRSVTVTSVAAGTLLVAKMIGTTNDPMPVTSPNLTWYSVGFQKDPLYNSCQVWVAWSAGVLLNEVVTGQMTDFGGVALIVEQYSGSKNYAGLVVNTDFRVSKASIAENVSSNLSITPIASGSWLTGALALHNTDSFTANANTTLNVSGSVEAGGIAYASYENTTNPVTTGTFTYGLTGTFSANYAGYAVILLEILAAPPTGTTLTGSSGEVEAQSTTGASILTLATDGSSGAVESNSEAGAIAQQVMQGVTSDAVNQVGTEASTGAILVNRLLAGDSNVTVSESSAGVLALIAEQYKENVGFVIEAQFRKLEVDASEGKMSKLSNKDVSENLLMAFNFKALSKVIVNPFCTIELKSGVTDPNLSTMLIGAPVVIGSRVFQRVQGGIEKNKYHIRCKADSLEGSSFVLSGILPVVRF